jgi:hypothetical protein
MDAIITTEPAIKEVGVVTDLVDYQKMAHNKPQFPKLLQLKK